MKHCHVQTSKDWDPKGLSSWHGGQRELRLDFPSEKNNIALSWWWWGGKRVVLETGFSFGVILSTQLPSIQHLKISDSISCLHDCLKILMTIQVDISLKWIFLLNSKKAILHLFFYRCTGVFACCYLERQDMSCTAQLVPMFRVAYISARTLTELSGSPPKRKLGK